MVDDFLRRMKDALSGSDDQQEPSNYDPQVNRASGDPYGDPADYNQDGYGDVRPASDDPYDDPAGDEQYDDPRLSDADPYGDPADENRW